MFSAEVELMFATMRQKSGRPVSVSSPTVSVPPVTVVAELMVVFGRDCFAKSWQLTGCAAMIVGDVGCMLLLPLPLPHPATITGRMSKGRRELVGVACYVSWLSALERAIGEKLWVAGLAVAVVRRPCSGSTEQSVED
jgi:hypothetical protein